MIFIMQWPQAAFSSIHRTAVAVTAGDRSQVTAGDPFRLAENSARRAITDHLLGECAVGMAEVGELVLAA